MIMRLQLSCRLFATFISFTNLISAFIPNELLGLSSPSSVFHTHITKKALLRHAQEFFASIREVKGQEIDGSSAKELFRSYYGPGAEWEGFSNVIDQVTAATADVDFDKATDKNPKWHFDAERFVEGQDNLVQLSETVIRLVLDEDYNTARETLGRLLHPLQDFYSHSNWIEMGNMAINRNLGVKGQKVGDISPVGQQTCVDCIKDFSSRLSSGLLKVTMVGVGIGLAGGDEDNIFNCAENVVEKQALTSGYYGGQHDDSGALVEKPPRVGKCSHGGPLDKTGGEHALGGLNKDSASSLLSPHDYLHFTAVVFAENASVAHLDYLRGRVNKDAKWGHFLQLLSGTSLAFVIDVSESMAPYVETVKTKIRQTVLKHEDDVTKPSEYIFVPFSQTQAGPIYTALTLVEVQELLLSFDPKIHLDSDSKSGGGRKLYEATMIAAQRSAIGGEIYTTTDGFPQDSHMMSWLDETMRTKRLTLHMRVASDLLRLRSKRAAGEKGRESAMNQRYYKDYVKLTRATGGNVVIADQEELERVVDIASQSGASNAFILLAQHSRSEKFPLLVDSTVAAFEVTIYSNDYVPEAKLFDINETIQEPSVYDSGLLYTLLQFDKPKPGKYFLALNVEPGQEWDYTVTVRVTTDIKLRIKFLTESISPGSVHPGMRIIQARPIMGDNGTLLIQPSNLQSLFPVYVQTRDSGYTLIDQFAIKPAQNGLFFAHMQIPEQSFYLRIFGYDNKGYPFMRTQPDLIEASNIYVDVSKPRPASLALDFEKIDKKAYLADFLIINQGLPGIVTVRVWDTRNFTHLYYPAVGVLAKHESFKGQILLEVPGNASISVATTLFLVAKSVFEGQSNVFQSIFTF